MTNWEAKAEKAEILDKGSVIVDLSYKFVWHDIDISDKDIIHLQSEKKIKSHLTIEEKLTYQDICRHFRLFDKDMSGDIDTHELFANLKYLGLSAKNERVKMEIFELMMSCAKEKYRLKLDEFIQFCEKAKLQKEKWSTYEECEALVEETKPMIDNIWKNAPKNSDNTAPWNTFLPIFWEGIGLSSDSKREENSDKVNCLMKLFQVKENNGCVTQEIYETFSYIFGALFPSAPNMITGGLFLNYIVELFQQEYFVGYLERDVLSKLIKSQQPDTFFLRISTNVKKFVVTTNNKEKILVSKENEQIEREHYYKKGIVDYIRNETMNKFKLKPGTIRNTII